MTRLTTCCSLFLLFYTAIPPERGKEYQELKLKYHKEEILGPLDTSPNVIRYSDYEVMAMLYLMECKMASSTGP